MNAGDAGERLTPTRQFWWLQVMLPACGLALLLGGFWLALERMMQAGVMVLAVAAGASGIACAGKRRVAFARRGWGFELWVWHGVAAVYIGCGLIVFALAVLGAALAHAAGVPLEALAGQLRARPSLALLPLGACCALIGSGVAIGFEAAKERGRGRVWNTLLLLPDRLGGGILAAIGLLLLAAGSYEWLLPRSFDAWIELLARGRIVLPLAATDVP